jgi:hypothetical protein
VEGVEGVEGMLDLSAMRINHCLYKLRSNFHLNDLLIKSISL